MFAFLSILKQKMWFCLFSQWERKECAWSCVSDGLKEVGPAPAAQRNPMILCSWTLRMEKSVPLKTEDSALLSEEPEAQGAASPIFFQKTCHKQTRR